jgi:hypothetical protein
MQCLLSARWPRLATFQDFLYAYVQPRRGPIWHHMNITLIVRKVRSPTHRSTSKSDVYKPYRTFTQSSVSKWDVLHALNPAAHASFASYRGMPDNDQHVRKRDYRFARSCSRGALEQAYNIARGREREFEYVCTLQL